MSSTTGENRIESDKYYTPNPLAREVVRWVADDFFCGIGPGLILEPSIGAGAFANACREYWPSASITGVDSDCAAPGFAFASEIVPDRFEVATLQMPFDLTVGNPPFSHAEEHAAKANDCTIGGIVALLLRSGFFHGKRRTAFWKQYPPMKEYRLVERPSFTGGGTDSAEYSVFVWCPGRRITQCVTERRSWK
jgi:hypothetical protein